MEIIIAIILGYLLRIFIENYVLHSNIPTLCKNCKYPYECNLNDGTCKHYIPKEENSNGKVECDTI